MNTSIPRLRMFAGPNGSGKSTFKTLNKRSLDLLMQAVQYTHRAYIFEADFRFSITFLM